MARLTWDEAANRLYETGVKKGVLYVFKNGSYQPGVAWNGLISVTESPSGAEPTPLYADDIKYLNLLSAEEFAATVEAFMYPEAFAECNGEVELYEGSGVYAGQQPRKTFALCYQTTTGNAEEGNAYGKKIHIIYGCLAAPSEKAYSSINDTPEATTFSWEISTTPVEVVVGAESPYKDEVFNPTASATIDSTEITEDGWNALINKLYGSSDEDATILLPGQLIDLLDEYTV